MMKYRGTLLKAVVLGMMLAVPAGAAETEGEAVGKIGAENYSVTAHVMETEGDTDLTGDEMTTITADYSALDYGDQKVVVRDGIKAFSDADCEDSLELQMISSGEKEIIYQFEQEEIPEMVYLIPPILSVLKKVEKTELRARDEEDAFDAGFWIKDVFVQKVRRGLLHMEPAVYEVNVIIDSESGEYPNDLKMISGGRTYSGTQSESFLYSDPAAQNLSEFSFQYEVSDDAAAALEILDHASFVYYGVVHFEAANDWDFSCEDAKLQVIGATVNG